MGGPLFKAAIYEVVCILELLRHMALGTFCSMPSMLWCWSVSLGSGTS